MTEDNGIFGQLPSHSFWQMDLIGDHLFSVAVPSSYPSDFKKMVFAAAKTYMLGNKSIDYVLKRYGGLWDFEGGSNPYVPLYLEICACVDGWVGEAINRFSAIQEKRDHHGHFASGAALLRLQVSFSTALLLLREGKWLELACIQKLILEQLAWSYMVRDLEGDALFKTLPSKAIKLFQAVFPEAGQLYGWFNRNAHVNPEETVQYLDFSGDVPRIFLSSHRRIARAAYHLLKLADIYQVCSEIIYCEYYSDCVSIETTDGKFGAVRKSRPFVRTLKAFKIKLKKLIQSEKHHSGSASQTRGTD